MTELSTWDADGLRQKASLYFERGFNAEEDQDPDLFAFWMHLGLELLIRASVASVNPLLLAQTNAKREEQLEGLGLLADANPLQVNSTAAAEAVKTCELVVDGFGPAQTAVCNIARAHRNAELHGATAALSDLDKGWRGRFFATCKILSEHLNIQLTDLFGKESAALAERLIVEDAKSLREDVQKKIEAAQTKVTVLSPSARKEREEAAELEVRPRFDVFGVSPFSRTSTRPRVVGEVPCPACQTTVALRGEIVRSFPPRINRDGELVQIDVAVPSLLECPVCELSISGIAQLTDLGLGEPVQLIDHPDPVEALDINVDDYRDEILQSMADEYPGYEDE